MLPYRLSFFPLFICLNIIAFIPFCQVVFLQNNKFFNQIFMLSVTFFLPFRLFHDMMHPELCSEKKKTDKKEERV